jgi:hypothetical protein
MSQLPEVFELGPEEEAGRLWRGAQEAQGRAPESLVAMCEALDLGLRAAEILVTHRLQAVKDRFPATIGIQLETPAPEVDPLRDAVNIPNSLAFTAILDLLTPIPGRHSQPCAQLFPHLRHQLNHFPHTEGAQVFTHGAVIIECHVVVYGAQGLDDEQLVAAKFPLFTENQLGEGINDGHLTDRPSLDETIPLLHNHALSLLAHQPA